MSENTENTENTENNEVELSDDEAVELVDLSSYGIDSVEPNAENLFKLRDLYLEHHKNVESYHEKVKSGTLSGDIKGEVRKTLENTAPDASVTEIKNQIVELLYNLLETDPTQVVHVLSVVNEVTDYVQDTKNYVIDGLAENIKRETGVVETPDESADESKLVCQAARKMMQTLLSIAKLMPQVYPVPTEFPVKVSKATGDLLPDIPGLPKTRQGTSNTGRGAKKRRVRYEWKQTGSDSFVSLPDGILVAEIANMVVSKGRYRITTADLNAHFKPKGDIDQFSETPWTIEFETGTLRGFLPQK